MPRASTPNSDNPNTGVPNPSTQYYKDIDIFLLEGKEEILLEEAKYPYLKIDSISDKEKLITFFLNSENKAEHRYEKWGDVWVYHRVSKQGDFTFYYYELILPNREILYLKYAGDPYGTDYGLASASKLSGLKKVSYIFSPHLKVKAPPPNDFGFDSTPIKEANYEAVETIKFEEGILENFEVRKFYSMKTELKTKLCYPMGSMSISWYIACYFMMEFYEC